MSNSAYQNCIDSGRTEGNCQNYYKVLIQLTDTDLMLCGTSAYQPICDIRHVSHKSRIFNTLLILASYSDPSSLLVLY